MDHYKTEIVIIGGGLAGIAMALELLDANRQVLILDRDADENFGGEALWSGGGVTLFASPIQRLNLIPDSIELGLADWFRRANFSEDALWPKQWAQWYVNTSIENIYTWYRKKNIQFVLTCLWVERGVNKPLNSVPRFHMVRGGGSYMMKLLISQLKNHPNANHLTIKHHHCVEDIDHSGSNITGCHGHHELSGQPFRVTADIAILSAGGMSGGDLSYLRENWYKPWGPPPTNLLRGAHRFADGLLHRAAIKHGFNVTHLDQQWIYPVGLHQPEAEDPNEGFNLPAPPSAFWINALGERIGPPPLIGYSDHRYQTEQICQQPGQYSWLILNWKIAIKEIFVSGYKYSGGWSSKSQLKFLYNLIFGRGALISSLLEHCVDILAADSLSDLVTKMNELETSHIVDLSHLEKTIKNYDAEIDRGRNYFTDEQLRRIDNYRHYKFDRLRVCKFQKNS